MKAHQSRPPHDSLQTALRSAFPIDARRLAVLAALVLAMIQARTVVLYALKSHVQLPGALDMRYQRLRRFVQFQLPDGLFTRFALATLPEGDLELILDRTNWKVGQQDVNILLLSAVWSGFSLSDVDSAPARREQFTAPSGRVADTLPHGLPGSEDHRSV